MCVLRIRFRMGLDVWVKALGISVGSRSSQEPSKQCIQPQQLEILHILRPISSQPSQPGHNLNHHPRLRNKPLRPAHFCWRYPQPPSTQYRDHNRLHSLLHVRNFHIFHSNFIVHCSHNHTSIHREAATLTLHFCSQHLCRVESFLDVRKESFFQGGTLRGRAKDAKQVGGERGDVRE